MLTADELKSLPKGKFIIMKTGANPLRIVLHLFLDLGIYFGSPYIMEERLYRKVSYADKETLEEIESEYGETGGIIDNDKLSRKLESDENIKRKPTLRA